MRSNRDPARFTIPWISKSVRVERISAISTDVRWAIVSAVIGSVSVSKICLESPSSLGWMRISIFAGLFPEGGGIDDGLAWLGGESVRGWMRPMVSFHK